MPLDFGPLISAAQVDVLHERIAEAEGAGAVRLYQGRLSSEHLLPSQDTSAYMAPVALLDVPRRSTLYHAEPFGPVDSIVVVDTPDALISEMNVSNGSLVASIACDDEGLATSLAKQVRAFKVGINTVRSRGDRAEVFGGLGQSWRGCFVGGELLVRALTRGPPGELLPGNYEDRMLLPILAAPGAKSLIWLHSSARESTISRGEAGPTKGRRTTGVPRGMRLTS